MRDSVRRPSVMSHEYVLVVLQELLQLYMIDSITFPR